METDGRLAWEDVSERNIFLMFLRKKHLGNSLKIGLCWWFHNTIKFNKTHLIIYLKWIFRHIDDTSIKLYNKTSKRESRHKWGQQAYENSLYLPIKFCCSVAQSCLTLCDPMDATHRIPCPSPLPRGCSNSCPLSQWYHPTISSSVIPFSSLLSFPASASFPIIWLFTSGSLSIRASASA